MPFSPLIIVQFTMVAGGLFFCNVLYWRRWRKMPRAERAHDGRLQFWLGGIFACAVGLGGLVAGYLVAPVVTNIITH